MTIILSFAIITDCMNLICFQWNLVCDEKFKIHLSSTMFFLGVFFGAFLFGFISDHLGRKITLAICLYTQMPISLAVAFMPDFISFTIMRFVLGVWLQVTIMFVTNIYKHVLHIKISYKSCIYHSITVLKLN